MKVLLILLDGWEGCNGSDYVRRVRIVTPENRYYVDLSDPAEIRIITILGRPPDIMCMPKHAHYVGGIVIALQQFRYIHKYNRRYNYNNDSNESIYK